MVLSVPDCLYPATGLRNLRASHLETFLDCIVASSFTEEVPQTSFNVRFRSVSHSHRWVCPSPTGILDGRDLIETFKDDRSFFRHSRIPGLAKLHDVLGQFVEVARMWKSCTERSIVEAIIEDHYFDDSSRSGESDQERLSLASYGTMPRRSRKTTMHCEARPRRNERRRPDFKCRVFTDWDEWFLVSEDMKGFTGAPATSPSVKENAPPSPFASLENVISPRRPRRRTRSNLAVLPPVVSTLR